MPIYKWKGKSATGEIREGILEAPNPILVEAYLRRLNITPIKILPKKEGISLFERKCVSEKELATFTRQFATLLEAGLPIVKVLDTLSTHQKNKYFKKVIKDIKLKVESGSSISDALSEYPKIFPNIYVQMIRVGEISGTLESILKKLSEYLEKNIALKSKVKHALIYPFLLIFVTIVVVSIIMIFVVPKFASLFASVGQTLPTPTLILIKISQNFKKILLFFLLIIFASAIFLKFFRKSEKGKYITDKILLNFPIIGDLFHKVIIIRFARVFSTLLNSGIPLLQALTITKDTLGNEVIKRAVEEIRVSVSMGQNIAESMLISGVFPHLLVEMVKVGEASGNLEEMLNKVSEFYEEEVDRIVETLATLIEPILLIILGIIIGAILVALYLPIFQLGSVIGGV